MSEFTEGILFLSENVSVIEPEAHIFQPFLIQQLNDKWTGLFREYSNIFQLKEGLKQLSNRVPLLYFQHPADHGWGYNIFTEGQEVASVYVSYELDFQMMMDIIEARYSDDPVPFWIENEEIGRQIRAEVEGPEAYHQAVARQYENRNVQAFQAFGFDETTIKSLEEVITPTYFLEKRLGQVEAFKRLIGIEEMSWMSYKYLSQK
jgi:hypothetical protein